MTKVVSQDTLLLPPPPPQEQPEASIVMDEDPVDALLMEMDNALDEDFTLIEGTTGTCAASACPSLFAATQIGGNTPALEDAINANTSVLVNDKSDIKHDVDDDNDDVTLGQMMQAILQSSDFLR